MKAPFMLSSKTTASMLLLFANAHIVMGEELSALRGRYMNMKNQNQNQVQHPNVQLGGGGCEWKPPAAVPEDLDLWKTLLVGFPSGDKRLVFLQMEAMTGFLASDDWNFYFNGQSNTPFIKTNYPHSSGVWSWETKADQVALVVQNIRRSMSEYSEVMTKMSAQTRFKNNMKEFLTWRDHNILNEIYKYGWQIDFWMENGLYRDPFTHSVMDQASFEHYHQPDAPPLNDGYITFCNHSSDKKNPFVTIKVPFLEAQRHLSEGDYLGSCEDAAADPMFTMINKINLPSDGKVRQDPKCNMITKSCKPVAIISGDRLRDSSNGPAEEEVIGSVLMSNEKTGKHVTSRDNWKCLWDKLIVKNEGNVDTAATKETNFSEFMLQKMIEEIHRLVKKYTSPLWAKDDSAKRLVGLLREQLPILQDEVAQVVSGKRIISINDIFGPGEREARFFGKTAKP